MSQNDDMVVRFSGLKSGKYNYRFVLDDSFLKGYENEEIVSGNVVIDAVLERKEHLLMFTFQLQGEATVLCDRCLGEMKVPIEGEEHLCVRFSDTEVCEDEDVAVLSEDAFEIDLAQWLYEYVAVRIPMQHKHPEGECDPEVIRFIAEDEGDETKSSDGIDPRWEALKSLK